MSENELKEYILKHFIYHPNGTITRDDRKNSTGSIDKDGYLILKIKGKQYKAHRIAWLLNYGEFPINEIDHINRIKTDNRIENLRDVTRIVNILNREISPNKDTGVVGVHITKMDGLKAKYTTRFQGKTYRFRTIEDALLKRKELRSQYEYI